MAVPPASCSPFLQNITIHTPSKQRYKPIQLYTQTPAIVRTGRSHASLKTSMWTALPLCWITLWLACLSLSPVPLPFSMHVPRQSSSSRPGPTSSASVAAAAVVGGVGMWARVVVCERPKCILPSLVQQLVSSAAYLGSRHPLAPLQTPLHWTCQCPKHGWCCVLCSMGGEAR